MIYIVNKKTFNREGIDPTRIVYVGRPSLLGNPFALEDGYTRMEAIARYSRFLVDMLKKGNTAFTFELDRLAQLASTGHLYLECFCSPKVCHAEVIRTLIIRRLHA